MKTFTYVDGAPVSKVDPTGEFGIVGFFGAAAFNRGTHFLTNLYMGCGEHCSFGRL